MMTAEADVPDTAIDPGDILLAAQSSCPVLITATPQAALEIALTIAVERGCADRLLVDDLVVAGSGRADVTDLSLATENGEELPFADGTFDVVTSVYMFHELPRNARRRVVAEMARVVRPGGLVVIEDSAQLADSPELGEALKTVPVDFHEPFYRDYLEDDLAVVLAERGLEVVSSEPHLVARVVVARAP